MNFFKNIIDLGFEHVTVDIKTDKEGNVTAFVTPKIMAKDKALQSLKPVFITGTPEEVDQAFFETVSEPIKKVAGLHTNIRAFEAQADEVSKKTDMEKKQKDAKKAAEDEIKKITESFKTDEDWVKNKDKITKAADEVMAKYPNNPVAFKAKSDLKKKVDAAANVGLFGGIDAEPAQEPEAPAEELVPEPSQDDFDQNQQNDDDEDFIDDEPETHEE